MKSIFIIVSFILFQGLTDIKAGDLEKANTIDSKATYQTKALFQNLKSLMSKGILFGHQDATMYGINADGSTWKNEADRSDIKSVCGSHPAIYGWDMEGVVRSLTANHNDNNSPPATLRKLITEAYDHGGINTVSWHVQNYVTGKNFYDTTACVPAILPGGVQHEAYKKSLDAIASYFLSLKGNDGNLIPIIFRPFHEHTGSWFWWGRRHCTTEQYKALWQFTVHYLKDVKNVHNLLYAYSPDRFTGENEYLERYPGDSYVDILGFDDYGDFNDLQGTSKGVASLKVIVSLAQKKNKVAALSETGLEKVPNAKWFTQVLLASIKNDSVARNIAYIMVWRNAHTGHFYAPYPGHSSAPDFLDFYNDPATIFQNDLKNIYKPNDKLLKDHK